MEPYLPKPTLELKLIHLEMNYNIHTYIYYITSH